MYFSHLQKKNLLRRVSAVREVTGSLGLNEYWIMQPPCIMLLMRDIMGMTLFSPFVIK